MNTNIGIICCSFILKHIKSVLINREGFKIYPLVPACLFNVSSSLLRHVFEKASIENRTSFVAYGYCHKDLPAILEEYKEFVVKIPGDNCWEMLLGRAAFRGYVDEGCWLLRTAVCNEWRGETFLAYGASGITDNLVKGCNTKRITACRFEPEKPRDSEVHSFAQAFETPPQIVDCNFAHFSPLIEQGINAARQLALKPTELKTSNVSEKREPQIPGEITEIAFQFDICSKSLTFISPKVTQLLGFSSSEFVKLFITDPELHYYYDIDTFTDIMSQRYAYISNSISEGMQLPLSIEYKAKKGWGNHMGQGTHIPSL